MNTLRHDIVDSSFPQQNSRNVFSAGAAAVVMFAFVSGDSCQLAVGSHTRHSKTRVVLSCLVLRWRHVGIVGVGRRSAMATDANSCTTSVTRCLTASTSFILPAHSLKQQDSRIGRVVRLEGSGGPRIFRGGDLGNPTRTEGVWAYRTILCICELGRAATDTRE